MTQIAGKETVQANFQNVTLTNEETRFVLTERDGEFWVHIDRRPTAEPGETSAGSIDVRIGLLTGSHHMQVFWVPGGEGNLQIGFPFTWLIPEKCWVPRNSTFIRPPDMQHRSEVWNVVCSRCHTTGVEPRVDKETRTIDTRVGELGIACEACHGPGQRHVDARLADREKGIRPEAQVVRREIVHPKKIDPVRAGQICGFCHSMKWFDDRWRINGFQFRPGDDLERTTPIIQPSRVDRIPGLANYLSRNPDLLRDFFWPDGMIRVSGREYNGLLASPCYKSGKFSCLSCHSLHESNPDAQLARNRTGNEACLQCHNRFREETKLLAHTRHRADSPGSECYNCHMPFTTYGVLKGIRSHQVSSPRISVELATGRPNACSLCHLDKPLAWSADYLARWFQQTVPSLSPDETQVADSVRLALSGDAGQRALMAWHLSWKPAWAASGNAWIPPVLASLLDDPYAAVRCVAERSLKEVAASLLPAGYDYTLSPDARSAAEPLVVDRWVELAAKTQRQSFPPATLVHADDLKRMQDEFAQLTRRRDSKPMRLRE